MSVYLLACAALAFVATVLWVLHVPTAAAVLFAFVSGRLWQAHAAPEGPMWLVRMRLRWETRDWKHRFGDYWEPGV